MTRVYVTTERALLRGESHAYANRMRGARWVLGTRVVPDGGRFRVDVFYRAPGFVTTAITGAHGGRYDVLTEGQLLALRGAA